MDGNRFHFMVAAGSRGEIGAGGTLPWPRLPTDMRRFRHITTATFDKTKVNAVVMGRRTWDSLGRTPLGGRVNIVLGAGSGEAVFVPSVDACCAYVDQRTDLESVFVIGGWRTFESFLEHAEAAKRIGSLYITHVLAEFPDADTFISVPRLENFFPVVVHDTSDYDSIGAHFVLRRRHLSDI